MKFLMKNHHFLAITTTIAVYALLYLLRKLILLRAAKYSEKTQNRVDDVFVFAMRYTTQVFLIATSIFIGGKFHPLASKYARWSSKIYFVIFMIQLMIWGNHIIAKWLEVNIKRKMKRDPSAATSISVVQVISKGIFFIIIFLFTLHNLGIEITTMLAGLGVGGIAVALALQNILGDLFSSLSIVLDKPFVVGDFIVINEWMGSVEKIGLKTTRLRSLSGEQIIVSNSDLLASRIRNYKRMFERRVVHSFALSFQTKQEDILRAVEMMKDVISSQTNLRLERCHFMCIGTYSMNIELVYWVLSPDYNLHMDIQQKNLLEILTLLRNAAITLAYPTQSLSITPMENIMNSDMKEMNQKKSLGNSLS